MAAGELALSVLVTANVAQASGAISMLGGSLFGLAGGAMKDLGKGLSLMGFGLDSIGTKGIKSGIAIRDAAAQMGGALFKVAAVIWIIGVAAVTRACG